MEDRLISSKKVIEWLDSMQSDAFWDGDDVEKIDTITDAINDGMFDPDHNSKIKKGDNVKVLSSGYRDVIVDIQYVHNRYQLRNVSGWQYGIDKIQKDSGQV